MGDFGIVDSFGRVFDWLQGLGTALQILIVVAVILVLVFFPRLVGQLFSGRKISEIQIGLSGISVRLAADRIARANAIWNLPSEDTRELQDWLASLVRIPHILWVYDDPESVRNEIEALTLLGYDIVVVRTNEAAAKHYRGHRVDVIVSDIDREREGEEAGLRLRAVLEPLRNPVPPVFYYVGRVDAPTTPAGDPVTNMPVALFRMIGNALDQSGSSGKGPSEV